MNVYRDVLTVFLRRTRRQLSVLKVISKRMLLTSVVPSGSGERSSLMTIASTSSSLPSRGSVSEGRVMN